MKHVAPAALRASGQSADRHHGGPLQKGAAVDMAVAILVVEIVNALVDLELRQRRQRAWRGGGKIIRMHLRLFSHGDDLRFLVAGRCSLPTPQ